MSPRLFAVALLTGAIAVSALAADDTEAETDIETMEHVEVIGYPTPAATGDPSLAGKETLAAQMRKQQRRELLRTTQETQLQQMRAFRLEGNRETLAQEAQDAQGKPEQEASSIVPVSETEVIEGEIIETDAIDRQAVENREQEPS